MTKILINAGLVKSETQANYVLIGIAVVFFVLSVVMVVGSGNTNNQQSATGSLSKSNIPTEIRALISESEFESLPDKFYIEDVPKNILDKLNSDVINSIPSKKD